MLKFVDGKYIEMTQDEIKEIQNLATDIEEQPTAFDKLEAQVTYTAMMTDTLLVEEE